MNETTLSCFVKLVSRTVGTAALVCGLASCSIFRHRDKPRPPSVNLDGVTTSINQSQMHIRNAQIRSDDILNLLLRIEAKDRILKMQRE